MIIKLDRPLKKLVLLLPTLALSGFLVWRIAHSFLSSVYGAQAVTADDLEAALAWDGGNSDLHYFCGRLRQFTANATDLTPAIAAYRRAIAINPLVSVYWLSLGQAYAFSQQWAEADRAYATAVRLHPTSSQVRWEAANFWLQRGNLGEAFANFKAATEIDPRKLPAAMDLGWKVTTERERILREIIPDALPSHLAFLNFALAKKEYALAVQAWKRVLEDPDAGLQVSDVFPYFDALLREYQVPLAVQVWNQALSKCGLSERALSPGAGVSLVHNGGFEMDLLDGGFDWRMPPGEGFSMMPDMRERMEGYRSLRLEFNGKLNVDFRNLFQIVPVAVEGRAPRAPATRLAQHIDPYRTQPISLGAAPTAGPPGPSLSTTGSREWVFSYYIKTSDLSTDQGIFWELTGYPQPAGLHLKSNVYSGTTPWTQGQISLHIADSVSSILIQLRRLPSQKFDNLLKGTVWVDGIQLVDAQASKLGH